MPLPDPNPDTPMRTDMRQIAVLVCAGGVLEAAITGQFFGRAGHHLGRRGGVVGGPQSEVTMNLGPEVYVALILAAVLIAMMKYDDRKRAKRDAESQPSAG